MLSIARTMRSGHDAPVRGEGYESPPGCSFRERGTKSLRSSDNSGHFPVQVPQEQGRNPFKGESGSICASHFSAPAVAPLAYSIHTTHLHSTLHGVYLGVGLRRVRGVALSAQKARRLGYLCAIDSCVYYEAARGGKIDTLQN